MEATKERGRRSDKGGASSSSSSSAAAPSSSMRPAPTGRRGLPAAPRNFPGWPVHHNWNWNNHNRQPECFGANVNSNVNLDESTTSEEDAHSDEVAAKIWDYAYQMLLSQKFCDVVVTSQKGNVKAHRCVLAFHSNYLNEVFQSLSPEKKVIIRLDSVPVDTVRQMLCFFYSGDIKVTKFNLVDLLNVAEQYCFPGLQNACLEFFKDITPENAIFLLSLTNSMGLETMQRNVIRFIVNCFGQVSQTPDFVYLPVHLLKAILGDDDLQVYKELDAFYAVVRWVEYKRDQRICFVPELLSGPVRLELMSVDELSDEVESHDWLFCTQEAKDVLSEAYRKKLLMSNGYYPSSCVKQRNNVGCQF